MLFEFRVNCGSTAGHNYLQRNHNQPRHVAWMTACDFLRTEDFMSIKFQKISPEEIKGIIDTLDPELRTSMGSEEASKFLKISLSTLYGWVSYGYLEGTYRRRGKHLVFLTSRLVDKFYNGKDWSYPYPCKTKNI